MKASVYFGGGSIKKQKDKIKGKVVQNIQINYSKISQYFLLISPVVPYVY